MLRQLSDPSLHKQQKKKKEQFQLQQQQLERGGAIEKCVRMPYAYGQAGRQADRRERVRETERERERTKRVPFLTDGSRKS